MDDLKSLELELKELIVKRLGLEDVEPAEIDSEAPLFGEGLGLDSIDALELGIALHKRYHVEIEASSEETVDTFSSVRKLANFIAKNRAD